MRVLSTIALVSLLVSSTAVFAQERVDPVPDAPEQIVDALSPFRANPDSTGVADLLADEAASSGFPATSVDHVLAARLWRRAGEIELAMASLQAAASDDANDDVADLATYEQARVLLESGDALPGGVTAYWQSCSAMDEATRAELGWDLLAVATPEERDLWAKVEPGQPTCDWLRSFWDDRAQGMAISRDRRLATHYQRLAHATERYWIPRPRFLIGMAEHHGRPPGLAIDDRGLIYVRMGIPAHNEVCSAPDEGLLGECWAYERPTGYKLYVFAVHAERADGDFRLVEQLGTPQKSQPGDPWFQKYVMNADLPQAVKTRLVLRGGAAYRAEVRDPDESAMDRVEDAPAVHAVRLALRRFPEEALENVPDAPALSSTLNMRSETLRFLNPSSLRWQIWLVASVRAGDLQPSSESGASATLDVSGRFSVLSAERGVSIGEIAHRSVPRASISDDAGIGLRGVLTAPPGPLPLTIVIEDLNAPGTGAWHQDTVNVPAIGGLPQLSDIAVAQAEGGTWTRDGETFLQVTPAHITNPDGSIHTYFEVYGVRPGTRYEVEFRLAGEEAADRIWRLEPGDLGFRLQFTSQMAGEIGRHHLRLDLGDTEPGQYVLAVRIQDEDSGAYSLPSVTDVFVAKE